MILRQKRGSGLHPCQSQVHKSALGMRTEALVYLQLVCFDFLGNGPCPALSLTPPPPLKTHCHSGYYILDARQSHKHV